MADKLKELMMKIAERTMKMDLDVDGRGVWDWGAGVALYGLMKLFEYNGEKEIFDYIKDFVDESMQKFDVPKSVNTTAPLCSVLMLYNETGDKKYLNLCEEFADWLMTDAPRAESGAIEHSGVGVAFDSQVWIDTVFMAGVFLTRIGTITDNKAYIEEGIKQVVLHMEAIQSENGLFYHGYNYITRNHMSGALWARGNAWFTVSVPEIYDFSKVMDKSAIDGFVRQVASVRACQAKNGLWHTVMDDSSSYCEVSAAAGFVYGILLGIRNGLLTEEYMECAVKGAKAVIEKIDDDGTVLDVSTGTGIQEKRSMYNDMDKSLIMPWGQGLTIMMLIELDILNK